MKESNMFSNIEIIDVLHFKRGKVDYCTKKRDFNVLSLRVYGEAEFTQNNITTHITEKTALLIPKNIEYRQTTEGEQVIAIHFNGNTPFDKITTFSADSHIRDLFFEIVEFWQTRDNSGFYIAHSKLYNIFCAIDGTCHANTFKDKITIGYEEINMHFKDPELKIEDIAKQNGMSCVYFRREFKKRYNISPKKALIQLRLNNASMLLENGYCNVAETAIQSGFSDPNYFSSVFKTHYGISPLEYSKHKGTIF